MVCHLAGETDMPIAAAGIGAAALVPVAADGLRARVAPYG